MNLLVLFYERERENHQFFYKTVQRNNYYCPHMFQNKLIPKLWYSTSFLCKLLCMCKLISVMAEIHQIVGQNEC